MISLELSPMAVIWLTGTPILLSFFDIHEALAYTVPGIIAHESALKGGDSLSIPQFD